MQSMLASPSPTSSTLTSNFQTNTPTTGQSVPQSLPPAPPANFTILDLELLHFWTTTSVESFIDFDSCITLFRTTIVELGIIHPFLMHEILALSALHLSQIRPQKASVYRQAADTHFATALSLFQPEIANLSLSNCDACFAFSTTIFTHAWASQHPEKPSALFFLPPAELEEDPDVMHVEWVKLHRGSQNILLRQFPELRVGVFEPLFAPWVGLDPNHVKPLPAADEAQLSALSSAWDAPHISAEKKATLDEALYKVRRVFSLLVNNPEISKLSSVMSWFSMISEEYLKLLSDKTPEALLVAAIYCVALKKADNMWWVRGKGENLLRTVIAELGPEWERWTKWPIEQVLGNEGMGRDLRVGGILIDR